MLSADKCLHKSASYQLAQATQELGRTFYHGQKSEPMCPWLRLFAVSLNGQRSPPPRA
jgi:hypothetical protein